MKNHLVEKLQKAQVFTEPFNHLVIKDLLPDLQYVSLAFETEESSEQPGIFSSHSSDKSS